MTDTKPAFEGPDQSEGSLWRIGGLLAMVGGVIFMVANLLHPRSSDIDVYEEQIETVADSDIWIVDHLAFMVGAWLITLGLYALARSLYATPGAVWARLGVIPLVISGALVTVLMGLDGIASKFVHDSFAVTPGSESAQRVSLMMEEIDVGLFSVYILVFFGLTILLYGLAVGYSGTYRSWLGWVAVALGAASLIIGTIQAIDGLSVLITSVLFVLVASLVNVWVIVMGWYLRQQGRVMLDADFNA